MLEIVLTITTIDRCSAARIIDNKTYSTGTKVRRRFYILVQKTLNTAF